MKINFIKREKTRIIIEQIVWANLKNNYYFKLCNILKTGYQIEKIDLCHFFDILINSKYYIYRLDKYKFLKACIY